jgi:hypothetical protein
VGEQPVSSVHPIATHLPIKQTGASAPQEGSRPCMVQALPSFMGMGGRRQKDESALVTQA